MERTLETEGAIGVIRCLQRAFGPQLVFPGHGRAFQPAFRDLAGDGGGAQ